VTKADASHRALKLGLDTLADILAAQTTIILFTSSTSAVSKVLDANPHEEQKTSIECTERVDEILCAHPGSDVGLSWLPKAVHFDQKSGLWTSRIMHDDSTTLAAARPTALRETLSVEDTSSFEACQSFPIFKCQAYIALERLRSTFIRLRDCAINRRPPSLQTPSERTKDQDGKAIAA
jgi:hypothetical protein